MEELLEVLGSNQSGALATVAEGRADIRPFGFMFAEDSKFWFCTSNKKTVYKQIKENPNVAYTAVSKDLRWARLQGRAIFVDDRDVKARILRENELVRSVYKEASNPIFEVFYIDHGTASVADFSGRPPRTWTF